MYTHAERERGREHARTCEQRDDCGDLVRGPEEDETQGGHGGAAHIVVHVRHGEMQQLENGAVVARADVGHGDRVHGREAEQRVLLE